MCVVFFFKQKPAYEMRISDWSSDVCSSDLDAINRADPRLHVLVGEGLEKGFHALGLRLGVVGQRLAALAIAEPGNPARAQADGAMLALRLHLFFLDGLERLPGFLGCAAPNVRRPDEHTSEPQSLMRT